MDNIKEVIAPIKFIPFKNTKKKFLKGIKSNNQKEYKQKRNIILKINSNLII